MSELLIINRTFDFSHQFKGEDEPRLWALPRPKVGTHQAYAKYIQGIVLDGIEALRDRMSEKAYRIALEGWTDAFWDGRLNWKSKKWIETLERDGEVNDVNVQQLLIYWFQQQPLPQIGAETEKEVKKEFTRKHLEEMWETRRDDFIRLVSSMIYEANPTQR